MTNKKHEAMLIDTALEAVTASRKALEVLNEELENHLGTDRYFFDVDFCGVVVIEDSYTQAELPWDYQRFPKSVKELEKLFREMREEE